MNAAKKGLPPDYIVPLMNEFASKLTKFSQAKHIDTAKEYLAVSLAYYELLSFVMGGAKDIAAYAPSKRQIRSWYGQTILYKDACAMMKVRQNFFRLFKLESLALPLVKMATTKGA